MSLIREVAMLGWDKAVLGNTVRPNKAYINLRYEIYRYALEFKERERTTSAFFMQSLCWEILAAHPEIP